MRILLEGKCTTLGWPCLVRCNSFRKVFLVMYNTNTALASSSWSCLVSTTSFRKVLLVSNASFCSTGLGWICLANNLSMPLVNDIHLGRKGRMLLSGLGTGRREASISLLWLAFEPISGRPTCGLEAIDNPWPVEAIGHM